MKTTLIAAVLGTPAGPQIRNILRLHDEAVGTELLYVRLHRVAESKSVCDIRACIAKLEDGEFAEDAAEVVFRCLDVAALDWHSSFYEEKDRQRLEPLDAAIEIETEDCFRIVCAKIEVLSVRHEKLGDIVEPDAGANRAWPSGPALEF